MRKKGEEHHCQVKSKWNVRFFFLKMIIKKRWETNKNKQNREFDQNYFQN
jgi:hypothetical protein